MAWSWKALAMIGICFITLKLSTTANVEFPTGRSKKETFQSFGVYFLKLILVSQKGTFPLIGLKDLYQNYHFWDTLFKCSIFENESTNTRNYIHRNYHKGYIKSVLIKNVTRRTRLYPAYSQSPRYRMSPMSMLYPRSFT